MIFRCLTTLIFLFLLVPVNAAETLAQIRFNPFGYAEAEEPAVSERRSAGKTEGTPKPVVKPWKPVLLATIVAGEKSVANVAGKLVKIGQKVDGYKLLSVNRKSATFERSGHRYVLKLAARAKNK